MITGDLKGQMIDKKFTIGKHLLKGNKPYELIFHCYDEESNEKLPKVIKMADMNFVEFSRSIKLIQKVSKGEHFPSILHCGFFIHESVTDTESERSMNSGSSKIFSVGDRIKQYYVTS